ncbi:MAG: serpin family protein [Ruminococcus sp.]|nr:serpin family protein [Ruminococcus sp.]
MKKLLCALLSVIMVSSVLSVATLPAAAASKPVKLKKKSTTLKTSQKYKIKLKKKKGVRIKSITYKSSNKKIAVVTKKGKVTAKKAGKASIKIRAKYTYKGKKHKAKLSFKLTVKKKTESFYQRLSKFSNKLYNMTVNKSASNYSMSPVSIYMALAMLYSIGDKNVQSDVKFLTGMTDTDFTQTKTLYDKLNKEHTFGDKTVARLYLTNSLWMDSGNTFNSDAVSRLNKETACTPENVPFASDNKTANKRIREFIKEKTNGLIDKDFDLKPETLLALINTLYFKDIWDTENNELKTETRGFTTPDGKKNHEFILGKYIPGKTAETSVSEYFYAQTAFGYKIKFILPKNGHTLSQAMSADNLNKVNTTKNFKPTDKDGTEHYTRCIFPRFKLESETPLMDVMLKNRVLGHAFSNFLSTLTTTPLCVSDMRHNVVLDVSKEGIEGAAVTIFAAKATAILPTHPKKYHDFVLNKSFGFIITDPSDIVLFEGQVTNP